jgi:hypothetical protein
LALKSTLNFVLFPCTSASTRLGAHILRRCPRSQSTSILQLTTVGEMTIAIFLSSTLIGGLMLMARVRHTFNNVCAQIQAFTARDSTIQSIFFKKSRAIS